MAAEPYTGPVQASLYGPRPAAPPSSRVSPTGLHAGDRLVPRDNPLPTLRPRFPPWRAPPKAWAALALGTDSSPSNVPLRTDSPNPMAWSEVDGDAT